MVEPIYIIVIALASAFSLGIVAKLGKSTAYAVTLLALSAMALISLEWLLAFIFGDAQPKIFATAGGKAPFVIVLQMTKHEALFTFLVSLMGVFSTIYLYDKLMESGYGAMATLIVSIMGMNGMILTGDIFNLFVFMEITGISTAGLILLVRDVKALSAGFKYMLATGLISGMFLLGTIFIWYFTGTLNLQELSASGLWAIKGGSVAIFLVLVSLILELKPFPANGWGIDVYESAHPGVSALLSGASATAAWFVLLKVLPLGGPKWFIYAGYAGLATFVISNFLAIKQTNVRRMLGYSSIAQAGLLTSLFAVGGFLGKSYGIIIFGLLISNYLAKAGLFWLAGILKENDITRWGSIRKKPLLLALMGVFIFILLGFPPFPAFFAKWSLLLALAGGKAWFFMGAILVGSLLEAVYLLRWYGYAVKGDKKLSKPFNLDPMKMIPVVVFAIAGFGLGYLFSRGVPMGKTIFWWPLVAVAVIFLLDFLPAWTKNILVMVAMSIYGWKILPTYHHFKLLFGIVFIIGGVVLFIPGFVKKGRRKGFYPLALMMYAGLAGLLEASNMLSFFFAWEIMTLGSYLLILRGENARKPALSYILFSLLGAFFILAASALLSASSGSISLDALKNAGPYAPYIYTFMVIGFMTKIATIGFHIWLPDAYAEAEDDVSPMLAGVLIKSGVYGLMVVMLAMGSQKFGKVDIAYVLGWIGVITALLGNLMAVFEEDIKKLIAYSSIGQMGYILFALSLMSHLGWLTAVAFVLNHFVFKSLLFITVAGVIYRVKTRKMYEMGGLIKKMPISFISVMISIIAVSGVPPLTGFAGKWLSYNAIIFKGWYFQGFIISLSGLIAFLYLFRLVYTVFLGQPKTEHKFVKEAPIWFIIPQVILIAVIMVFSMGPSIVLKPIGKFLMVSFPENALQWTGNVAHTTLGYWSPIMIMNIVGGIFVILATWLFLITRKSKKVKQFNIVFAAERPFTPETSHYAYNFFAPYKKALGFMVEPHVTRFWTTVTDGFYSSADFVRRLYSGNAQTYALQLLAYILVFYFVTIGG
jgi:formate hydrogenlyase subunit 3/multisubunit Na+/H+ antiporter MnhD subunit